MGSLVDRTGQRYGRLCVESRDVRAGAATGGRRTMWICRCDCGAVVSKTGHELASGDTKSCGCLKRELLGDRSRTHGRSRERGKGLTYRSWQAAKDRCYNPNSHKYPLYGARGIAMCDRWRESFEAFLADMGERPRGRTLDRIDVHGGYTPENCRWATAAEQAANKQ